MITEQIWHHQTAELPPAVDHHPHRRRILASFYSGCGVLGLVIGVSVAELAAAPALIPPAAAASHGVTGPLHQAAIKTTPRVTPSATGAPVPARTVTLRTVSVPVSGKSARAVADDPTLTEEPTTEPTVTPSLPPYDGPTATSSGAQGMPTPSPTPPPSDPPCRC